MKIEHNEYFDGAVQSLAHVEDDETIISIDMFTPGDFDFGQIAEGVTIQVISGLLIINDEEIKPGESIVIQSGDNLWVEAKVPSTSVRCYDN